MSEEIKETPTGELEQGDFKIKKKIKKLVKEEPITKIDFKTPKENLVDKQTIKVDLSEEKKEDKDEDTPIIQEIKEEEVKEEVKEVTKEYKEAVRDEQVVGKQLPENIEKLVSFMEETGGNIDDYVRLNIDYTKVDDKSLLREYYKNTKPHLDHEEISFIMEDNFTYDEELDEERDIKKKKLAFKEEIAKAKGFLEETKSKYYDEIKLRPGVTQDQQKAMDFFNRYNENETLKADKHKQFVDKTKDYFTKDFKGFEFNLGDSKFKYNINNTDEVIDQQSDLSKFVGKFLDEKGRIDDHEGYHKAIYAARNADTIAKHFYEQGKSDGIKNIVNKSKNIDTASRPQNNEDLFINGFKVKAISGVDSSKLKIKTKNKN
tara:strand:- start:361 stop:1485 length:1125 start_codon:yes stop_codon:yes gene_type:complete